MNTGASGEWSGVKGRVFNSTNYYYYRVCNPFCIYTHPLHTQHIMLIHIEKGSNYGLTECKCIDLEFKLEKHWKIKIRFVILFHYCLSIYILLPLYSIQLDYNLI